MDYEEMVEKRYGDSEPLKEVDKAMGKTGEAAESELVKEINQYAEEIGVDVDMNQVNTQSRYSRENKMATLLGETHGGVYRFMGETTAHLYDNDDAQAASHKDPNGPAVRLGNGDINVNETNLRAAADWLETKGQSHLEPKRAS